MVIKRTLIVIGLFVSDILHREILKLLSSSSGPLTASFIGFSLPDFSFNDVCGTLDCLQTQGLITLDYLGYRIVQTDSELQHQYGAGAAEDVPTPVKNPADVSTLSAKESSLVLSACEDDHSNGNGTVLLADIEASENEAGEKGVGLSATSIPHIVYPKEDVLTTTGTGLDAEELLGTSNALPDARTQEQREFDELLSMLAIPEDAQKDLREKSDEEVNLEEFPVEEMPKIYYDSTLNETGLQHYLVDCLVRHGIPTVKDLVESYSLIESIPGISRSQIDEIRKVLHGHARKAPDSLNGESIIALCGISNSCQFVFDVFGQLICLEGIEIQSPPCRDTAVSNAAQAIAKAASNEGTPIAALRLSTRLNKILLREGYSTVERVAELTDENLLAMRGLGELAVLELRMALSDKVEYVPSIPDTELTPDGQTPISSLNLPNRLTKALIREGYNTVELAALLSDDDLLELRGVGQTAVREFRIAMQRWSATKSVKHVSHQQKMEWEACADEAAVSGTMLADREFVSRGYPIYREALLACMPYEVVSRLGNGRDEHEYRDLAIELIEGSDNLIEACERVLKREIEHSRRQETPQALANPVRFPDYPEWREAARRITDTDRWCELNGDSPVIKIVNPSLTEWMSESKLSNRNEGLLRMYLSGQTLQACGEEYGLTRERARQIIAKALKEAPPLDEDRYRHFFENYSMSKSEFLSITDEPIGTFMYLRTTKSKGSRSGVYRPVSSAINDENVPKNARDNIRRLMDKDYVYVDGNRILKRKDAIINYLVDCHTGHGYITSAALLRIYRQFLDDNGLKGVAGLSFSNLHAFEAYIDRCDQVMKLPHIADRTYGGSIRSYDAPSMDFSALAEELSLFPLGEVECSTVVLMKCKEMADILEELDIRNELELHYVLSHYCQAIEGVKLGRCPNITFGNGNRNEQILEMIKELSPVSTNDLAATYSERYGVDAATFAGSYLSDFKIYRRNGRFTYTEEKLTDAQQEFLCEQFDNVDRDYFSISLLKARFKARFPESSTALVSGENINSMGFHPSGGLLVRNGTNERALFAKLIDSKRRFSVDDPEFGRAVFDNSNFQAELAIRIRAYEIVEFEKGRYLSTLAFESIDDAIHPSDFKEYVDTAISFMDTGRPYTVRSLNNLGFKHKIDILRDDFGLSDFFFASILSTGYVGGRLKGTSIGSVQVFCRTPYAFSAPMIVEWIVERETAMEVDDLSYLLKDEYGIEAGNALLRTIIARTDLYFSESLDMVFESEETYKRKALEWIS